jgi:hypothetical protein
MAGVAITCLPCLWDCLTAAESALLAARVRGMLWMIRSRLFIGMIGCPDPSWANACSADPFYTEVSRLDCVCLVWSGLFWSFVAVCCDVLCFCIWVLVFIAECVQCCRRVFWSRGSGNSERCCCGMGARRMRRRSLTSSWMPRQAIQHIVVESLEGSRLWSRTQNTVQYCTVQYLTCGPAPMELTLVTVEVCLRVRHCSHTADRSVISGWFRVAVPSPSSLYTHDLL